VISGSPTGTYSDSGKNYAYFQFTGNGSLSVAEPGFVDVLVVAAGGGAGAGASSQYGGCGGGGGGMLEGTFYLSGDSFSVVVGAAGANASSGGRAAGTQGNDSSVGNDGRIVAFGGGYGSGNGSGTQTRGSVGGSGGGQYATGTNRGVTGQGNVSSSPNFIYGASGGGAGGAGVTGVGSAQGSYGPGKSSSISGTSVEYARGGGGGGQPKPGTANYGNGGSSEYANNNAFELPQQGIVIVRVEI